MPYDETRAKIEQEILEGKLGVARDRLHGLIVTYPHDLSLRSRLGDVYWALGYPALAGQWWFLDEDLTDEKRQAIHEFARAHRNDVKLMMHALKLGELDSDVADRAAERLAEWSGEGDFDVGDLEYKVKAPVDRSLTYIAWGCGAVVILVLALAAFGLIKLLFLLF